MAVKAFSIKVPREALEDGVSLELRVVDSGGVLSVEALHAPRGFLPPDMNGNGAAPRAVPFDPTLGTWAAPRGFLPEAYAR